MSVRAYHLRRAAYRKQSGPVGIPGKPSTTNRAYRRFLKFSEAVKCECGNCLPGQDRECPARGDWMSEGLKDSIDRDSLR